MARAKRKSLPEDFEARLAQGDLEALKTVFDSCDVNARGGSAKRTALAHNECPDALARWLVVHGADIEAADSFGETPLHARAGHWQGRIEILLELGADVHSGENGRGTPLHKAAATGNVRTARLLLDHGARVDALNGQGQTALVYALQRCSNAQIMNMAEMAELLLEAAKRPPAKTLAERFLGWRRKSGIGVTPETKAFIGRIGTDFEFHRAGFTADTVDATSTALDRLYVLFDVPPVPRRAMHDGKAPIVARAAQWEDRHQDLWEALVPSAGAAETVQGEIVRIAGRIRDELEGNGGVNWDAEYRKMADAFLVHIGSGVPLPPSVLGEARGIVSRLKARQGDTARLCQMAVEWVALNPKPKMLTRPDYSR